MDQERDKQLGKYLLKSRLGKGGMGVVYLATDSRLQRDVALKVLPKSMLSNPVAVKRFLQEARVAANISHPNVVTVHDVDQIKGQCFLVMELMTGGTAQDLLKLGPLDWWEATRIIADTCRGLIAIHEAGLIHRDIKPSNIMLAAKGVVKLTDFGLAKVTETTTDSKRLTVQDSILGTPQYMSPEQCEGGELDCRSDLYSLGATYFALLTGTVPFPDSQPLQCMFAHCSKPVPDPRSIRSDISRESAEIVLQAMAKRRVDRFGSAREMLVALKQCLGSDATASSRLSWLSGVSNRAKDAKSTVVDVLESTPLATTSTVPDPVPVTLIDPYITVFLPRGNGSPIYGKKSTKWMLGGLSVLVIGFALWNGVGRNKPHINETKVTTPGSALTAASTTRVQHQGRNPQLTFEASFPATATQVSGVAFASDTKTFYSGSMDGMVVQWDIASRQVARKFEGVQKGIRAIVTHQNWIVAGGEAQTVWIWQVNSEKPFAVLNDFLGEISSLAISPDGSRLAVGTYSELRLYRLDDTGPSLIKVLGTSAGRPVVCYMVMSVAFSADSHRLAATSWADKSVAIWNAHDGSFREVKRDQGDQPMSLVFLPDEDRIIFGSSDAGLFVWDVARSEVQPFLPARREHGSPRKVRSMAKTTEGGHVLTIGEWGGLISVYDLHRPAKPLEISKQTGTSSLGLDISDDDQLLIMCGAIQIVGSFICGKSNGNRLNDV